MARNTNINEILFTVKCNPVFLENIKHPIPGYKAITGEVIKNFYRVFSIVSDNYLLITNQEALDMGKEIHAKLFPEAKSESFEVFNVIAPQTYSFCQIDIIDKNYSKNIGGKELYVPFVRIQNSYNRSRKLKFDLGFCRKLCNNGVIFEQEIISININHTKQSVKELDLSKIDVSMFKYYIEDFTRKTQLAAQIKLPRRYFLPLSAKILNRRFNLKDKNEKRRNQTVHKLLEFIYFINEYTDKYVKDPDLGETAYTLFNVVTDYASNFNKLQASMINGLQTNCGAWLNMIVNKSSQSDFSWDKEIKDFEYLQNTALTNNNNLFAQLS